MEQTANNKEALPMTGLEAIKIQDQVDEAVAEIGKVVLGKEKQIRLSLCCLFAGGHLLMEDKPGMGKTTLSQALIKTTGKYLSGELMKSLIATGRYRHYKGRDYQVVGTTRHTETEEDLVLYYPLYGEESDRRYWVRPLDIFTGQVMIEGIPRARFEYLQDDETS